MTRVNKDRLLRQGILPFVYRLGDRQDVTARAGLPLFVEAMRALGLDELAAQELAAPKRNRGFSPAQKLEAMMTLITAGGEHLEDIRILSEDKGLELLLGGSLPSPDALLDFLGTFHDESAASLRPVGKKAFVPPESAGLAGLDAIRRQLVARGASREQTTATIDHDGTIIEAHKREARRAYEGTRGYQPLVAVWAEEDLIVADEFRDGNVAGGEDPLMSVRRAFANLPDWIEKRYYRADSASYNTKLLKWLVAEEIEFTISADMTKPLHKVCQAAAENEWVLIETRARELVHAAEVEFTPGDWPKNASPLRYVAIRFTPRQVEMFDGEEPKRPKHLAIASNRHDLSPADLMRWHWQKAGTIEHSHRIMKDELGAGVMPSGKFGVNAAWFRINSLVYDILTILKRRALPERLRTARPKRLRFEVFTIPAKLAISGRRLSVRASVSDERMGELIAARGSLLALRAATRASKPSVRNAGTGRRRPAAPDGSRPRRTAGGPNRRP